MVSAFKDRVLLRERCCVLLVDEIKVQQLYFLFVSMKTEQRALLSIQHLKWLPFEFGILILESSSAVQALICARDILGAEAEISFGSIGYNISLSEDGG